MKAVYITILIIGFAVLAKAQTTTFSYQGKLNNDGMAATSPHDFEFKLFDAATSGTQLGATQQLLGVPVSAGVFTVTLDFGSQFTGSARWLEISVKNAPGPFTLLTPRQRISSSPYAIKSLDADTATTANNALNLGGVAANQFVVTTDPRMTDARTPSAGSGNYIQNQNAVAQPATNFNISGAGTADRFAAATRFDLSGRTILRSPAGTGNLFLGQSTGSGNSGTDNTFLGANAGQNNGAGSFNTFVGRTAGLANTVGEMNTFLGFEAGYVNDTSSNNSFFGYRSGRSNSAGAANAFFGADAGVSNTTGSNNSFFGQDAGRANNAGGGNAFFGKSAGTANNLGGMNTFVGFQAGLANTGGDFNVFIGGSAGGANTNGNGNVFIGLNAAVNNTIGSGNVVIGNSAGLSSSNLSNAVAIGEGVFASSSNAFMLGNASHNVQVLGNLSVNGTLTANLPSGDGSYIQNRTTTQTGTTNFNISGDGTVGGTLNATTVDAAAYRLGGERILRNTGTQNISVGVLAGSLGVDSAFFGYNAGNGNLSTGTDNSFFGSDAGGVNSTGDANAFFGSDTGDSNTTGSSNSFFGRSAGSANSTANFNSFFGAQSGQNATGGSNSFFGMLSGSGTTSGTGNVFVGKNAGDTNTSGDNNTIIGNQANVGSANLSNATAIGAGAVVSQSNTVVVGRGADNVIIPGSLSTSGPLYLLAPGSGLGTAVCMGASTGGTVGSCSSSLRYKENVQTYAAGLEVVRRLRPVTFDWKTTGLNDVGFAAEEVAAIEPLLATQKNGQVEGVKYAQLTTVLVNAVNEQQATIETQAKQLKEHAAAIEALKKIVCRLDPSAKICQP